MADRDSVLANGCHLGGERYRPIAVAGETRWARLGDVCSFTKGVSSSTKTKPGPYPLIVRGEEHLTSATYQLEQDAVCVPTLSLAHGRGQIKRLHYASGKFALANLLLAVQPNAPDELDTKYLYFVLDAKKDRIAALMQGAIYVTLKVEDLAAFQIPLPPLEVQKEIVAEIEGYQKVIDGARAVVDNYRPYIAIDPEWPIVQLGQVCVFKRGPFGGSLKKEIFVESGYAVYEQSHAIANDFSAFRYFIDENKFTKMRGFQVRPGELIMSCSGTMGKVAIIPESAPAGIINQALLKLTPTDRILGAFLKLWMESTNFQQDLAGFTYGAAIRNVASVEVLKGLRLPLPPLATQQAIVAEIEAEQALVEGNGELIARFEAKIQATLARIWGEDEAAPAEA